MSTDVPPRPVRTRSSGEPVPPPLTRAVYPPPGAPADPTRRLTTALLHLGQELERTVRTLDALIADVDARVGDADDATVGVPAEGRGGDRG